MKQRVLPASQYHRESGHYDRQFVFISLVAVEILGMREAGGRSQPRRMFFHRRVHSLSEVTANQSSAAKQTLYASKHPISTR